MTVIELIKKFLPDSLSHFVIFTLLWLLTFLSFLPFLDLDELFNSFQLNSFSIFQYINNNQNVIFSFLTLFLLVDFFLLIMFLIANKTDHYYYELKKLSENTTLIFIYIMLLFQLFRNVNIINYSTWDLFRHYDSVFSIRNLICIFMYAMNLIILMFLVGGYFYRSRKK